VASHPTRHRVRNENYLTLVVFDEIHHGGGAKSWGEAIREAYGDDGSAQRPHRGGAQPARIAFFRPSFAKIAVGAVISPPEQPCVQIRSI
jgi:hypothetical protein